DRARRANGRARSVATAYDCCSGRGSGSRARIGVDEIVAMSREQHRQAFLAGLIGDFDCYLARDEIDPLRDGASSNLAAMWLDDAELAGEFGELGGGLG